MTPEQGPTTGTIDARGTLTRAESHVFEVRVTVSRPGQPDATVNREYRSKDAASTDKAIQEVWSGVSNEVKARMRTVNDGA